MKRLFALLLPAVCLAQTVEQVPFEAPVSSEPIAVTVDHPDVGTASISVATVQPIIDAAPLSVIVKEPTVKSASVVVTLDLEATEKTMKFFYLADKYPQVSSDSPLGALIMQGNAEIVEAFFEARKKEGK